MREFVDRYVITTLCSLFCPCDIGTSNRLRHPFRVSLRGTTCHHRVVLWFQVKNY